MQERILLDMSRETGQLVGLSITEGRSRDKEDEVPAGGVLDSTD